ncbi:MAG: amino acid permease [Firmicutes bacterium HGW-Firmicutes-10]|nr:MAG: amino acid permease [Firmicutes bacterium HGW-Firmicutes-10]
MESQQQRKFGLLTTVAMIAGIVIGSGIFFKTDDILRSVGGNVLLSSLGWVLGAVGIIFGGLTIAQYAKREDTVGGIITYSEMAWGKTLGYLAGWFQIVFYYPALVAIIAWVAASYILVLFGAPGPFSSGEFTAFSWVLTVGLMVVFFVFNSFATKAAGKFQSFALIAKVSALVVLALFGLVLGNPIVAVKAASTGGTMSGLFVALIAIAFAYDGWLVAPSVAHEIKNPKRNLPLALTFAPILIMLIYLAYTIGLTSVLGADVVMELGNAAVGEAATMFFGAWGPRIIYVFVVISILGTFNGLILGFIRLPYALALREEVPFSAALAVVNKKFDIPLASALVTFFISLVWLFLHFLSTSGVVQYGLTMFEGLEIDGLPIVLTYVFYVMLYIGVIKKAKVEKLSILNGYIIPVLAVLGAAIVIYGGLSAPKFNMYFIISLVGIGAGLLIKPKKSA